MRSGWNKWRNFYTLCYLNRIKIFLTKEQGFVSRFCYCTANKYPSTSISVQVLQSGGRDVSGSLYIFSDSKRYLINAGENTLRHLRDSQLAVNGMDQILLTGSTLNHIGGLTNTLLATQDIQSSDFPISVHGPHNLEAYMHTTRQSFQYLSKFDFVKLGCIDERTSFQEILSDENFNIWSCAIKSETSRSETDSIYPRLAISYAFELQQPPRRILVNATQKLGISQEMFHVVAEECQMGRNVTLPNGQEITPNDVLHPEERKQSFLIVDCPSQLLLKSLKQLIQSYISNQDPHSYIDLIIHLTPLGVVQSKEYKSWIDHFDGRTNHLLLNNDSSSSFSAFDKVYDRLTSKHSEIFPALNSLSENSKTLKNLGFSSNVFEGLPSLKYVFRPYRVEGFQEITSYKRVSGSVDNQRDIVGNTLKQGNDFEVIFLGTGSRVSSILRNTSGILLNMSGNISFLMDCGEGTYRQMCHHYGKGVNKILKQLRTVFVSHMHIDHHLGLANILLQRKRLVANNDFVRVIGPESLDLFLRYFEMLSGEALNFRFTQFWWLKRESGKKQGRKLSESLGLSSIDVVPTKHSDYSHGVVLKRNGWKIVYSADTRPCRQLIDAGEGASLLIHEATFSDDMIERAKSMNHCTVSEAIRTSKLMKAEHTILTHISSRHLFPCKISRLPKGVSFALDHMTVQQKDLPKLHDMMPSVEKAVRRSHQTRTYARRKRKDDERGQTLLNV